MDVSTVSQLASSLSQARTGDAVGVQVLKKAMDLQAQNAAQLIAALPQAPANPPHLGQSIDVRV